MSDLDSCPQITVVTDAMSPEGYFPVWFDYYSREFGADNIILVTYAGMAHQFSNYDFREIYELDDGYNDDLRLSVMNRLAQALVGKNRWLVRVDTDEIVVADPRKYKSLRAFIAGLDTDYVTARGFDVIQSPREDRLDFSKPILLEQRKYAFALAALNKTCLASRQMHWGRGFHYCSVYPKLNDLYLFHLKRCDTQFQKTWATHMLENIRDDDYATKYYEDSLASVDPFVSQRFEMPIIPGGALYDRVEFYKTFFDAISLNTSTGVFEGKYMVEDVNVEIPREFRGAF